MSGASELPSGLSPVCIAVWPSALTLWGSLGPGSRTSTPTRSTRPSCSASASTLWRTGQRHEIKAYLIGRWWPRRRHHRWGVLFPVAVWFVRFHQTDNYDTARISLTRAVDRLVTSPVLEEMVFRGVFLTTLLRYVTAPRGLLILFSGVLFASAHGPDRWDWLVFLVVMGRLLGYG